VVAGYLAVNVRNVKYMPIDILPYTNVIRMIKFPLSNEFSEKRIPYPHFVTTIHTLIRLVA
jgi:hypothetical protein